MATQGKATFLPCGSKGARRVRLPSTLLLLAHQGVVPPAYANKLAVFYLKGIAMGNLADHPLDIMEDASAYAIRNARAAVENALNQIEILRAEHKGFVFMNKTRHCLLMQDNTPAQLIAAFRMRDDAEVHVSMLEIDKARKALEAELKGVEGYAEWRNGRPDIASPRNTPASIRNAFAARDRAENALHLIRNPTPMRTAGEIMSASIMAERARAEARGEMYLSGD